MPKYTDIDDYNYNYTVPKNVEELFCRYFFGMFHEQGMGGEDDNLADMHRFLNSMEIDTDKNEVRMQVYVMDEDDNQIGTEYYVLSVKKEV